MKMIVNASHIDPMYPEVKTENWTHATAYLITVIEIVRTSIHGFETRNSEHESDKP